MSVSISVERLLEQEVDEINRSGEEVYVKPFSFSEELAHFATKIDFFEGIEYVQEGDDVEKDETKAKTDLEADKKGKTKWHWENVHSKLRVALSETCVMLDVLQNLNKKKYLVLDPIQQNAEPEKQTVQMLEKRKYLAHAGSIIAAGASALRKKKDLSEPIIVEDNDSEYYMQLMQLRQYWRVKKSGNQITGDVSYRSAGSKFWHPGLFEVTSASSLGTEKTLSVNISPDLLSLSYIKVTIIDKWPNNAYTEATTLSFKHQDMENNWEQQLKIAQHNLFNKELFSLLSNNAFQGSVTGVEVLQSHIKCRLQSDIQVLISHGISDSNKDDMTTDSEVDSSNEVKLLLMNLLQMQHKQMSKWHTPYPATANFYKKQTNSSTNFNLLNRNVKLKPVSILTDFLAEVKHIILLRRLQHYLRQKSKMLKDPIISFHWNPASTTSLTISITTNIATDKRIRKTMLITIQQGNVDIIFDDASRISFPFDLSSFDIMLNAKLQSHLLDVSKCLCLGYEWLITSNTPFSETIINTKKLFPECRLKCHSMKKNVSIVLHLNNIDDIEVEISRGNIPNFMDSGYESLDMTVEPISWRLVHGESFVEKLTSLLLCL